ncbi:MAG: cytochrome c maturation protein CcmE [Xanthomonadales bacterium]|nr:cytochrome c maturation protein CcmE [Xanthomonadales bacterium]
MTPTRKRRLIGVSIALAGLAAAAGLVVWALGENMSYFASPSDLAAEPVPPGRAVRLGGLVEPGSVVRSEDGLEVRFVVTDGLNDVTVHFDDILPDLFREGQGVIAPGAFDASGTYRADSVLAKHDENYMSPEVAEALERAGHPLPS